MAIYANWVLIGWPSAGSLFSLQVGVVVWQLHGCSLFHSLIIIRLDRCSLLVVISFVYRYSSIFGTSLFVGWAHTAPFNWSASFQLSAIIKRITHGASSENIALSTAFGASVIGVRATGGMIYHLAVLGGPARWMFGRSVIIEVVTLHETM